MKVYSDVTRMQRAKWCGAAMFGVSCFLMAPAEAATPAISGAAAEKMAAASPQRERHRAWAMCVDHVANLVIAQGGNMEKVRSMIPLGCEEEESRLTGSLIAKYGYEQGNAAMRALQLSAESGYAARIAKRDNPPKPPGLIEKTAEGWEVRRFGKGCLAITMQPNGLNAGGRGVALQWSTEGSKIDFILLGNEADLVNKKVTETFAVSALAYDDERDEAIPLTLMPHTTSNGFLYEAAVTDELIAQLEWAKSLQIMVPGAGSGTWPTIYPLRGLRNAWAARPRRPAQI
jgi:hypothetical protein